ncbi:MAG: carboxypeptidase regulatory-like domain-containing protein [Candidatus Eremiobacteraeota bacterium]|nr:carboxypeptidase regulatory-like domain-containing protein [Candidatus Eremiobacteraeota bacterium]
MKRALVSLTAVLLAVAGAARASAQVAITVGSVRDQQGQPIEGATVTVVRPAGLAVAAQTDSAGTFALRAEGVTELRVTCRYCRTASVAVREGEPVVAIVLRYVALSESAPSPADLDNLPYAHIESAIALRPFTLLSASSSASPGTTLSDRGLSNSGSLLIDDGAPNYDIASGTSPYNLIPAQYERSTAVASAANAYLYGDQAGGGTVVATPFLDASNSEVATLGSRAIARLQTGSDAAGVVASSLSDNQESRQRADLFASWPLAGEQSLSAAAGTEQGRLYSGQAPPFSGDYSFADATFSAPRFANFSLTALTDRGAYAEEFGDYPVSTVWSDSGIVAGVHSNGPISGFAHLAFRNSTGIYDAQALPFGLPRIAAVLTQTHADAGVTLTAPEGTLTAGVGGFWIGYSGGSYGVSQPQRTALLEPSLQAHLFPNGKLSATLEGSGSFTLPTFVQQYQYAGPTGRAIALTRNSLLAGALTYTDDSRVSISLESADESFGGAQIGTIDSTGLSGTWQIAPALALRAWTMRVTQNLLPIIPAYPWFDSTVNAFWLTYAPPAGGLRLDAIYRRDMLDGSPFFHFDGAISGPIAGRVRWYAGAESWMHRTFLDAGLRIGEP